MLRGALSVEVGEYVLQLNVLPVRRGKYRLSKSTFGEPFDHFTGRVKHTQGSVSKRQLKISHPFARIWPPSSDISSYFSFWKLLLKVFHGKKRAILDDFSTVVISPYRMSTE